MPRVAFALLIVAAAVVLGLAVHPVLFLVLLALLLLAL